MRQVAHRLAHSLELLVLHFVYRKGEQNWYWESPDQAVEGNEERVSDDPESVRIVEEA